MSLSTPTQFGTDCPLMLHLNGTNGSTAIVNSSVSGDIATAFGDGQISTAQSVFGGASFSLSDAGGGQIDITPFPNTHYVFLTGDFTIDFRVRFTSFGADDSGFLNYYTASTDYWGMRLEKGSNQVRFKQRVAGVTNIDLTFAWTPSTGTWYHVALTKSGNNYRLFIDGVQVGTTQSNATSIVDSGAGGFILIGGAFSETAGGFRFVTGFLDEFRIVKGSAIWTANFTPPSAAYLKIASNQMFPFF